MSVTAAFELANCYTDGTGPRMIKTKARIISDFHAKVDGHELGHGPGRGDRAIVVLVQDEMLGLLKDGFGAPSPNLTQWVTGSWH